MRKLTTEEVKIKLFEIHGDTITLEDEYVNSHIKITFKDKIYGEWKAAPCNVLYGKGEHPARQKEKTKQVCLIKYGCENPFQNKEIQEKYKRTRIERWGSDIISHNEDVQKKVKRTNLEKYGVEYPAQN